MKKKTVGIISMQRIVNYGSFLQAFAFKNILKEYSDDIVFIDYKIEKPVLNSAKKRIRYIRNLLKQRIFSVVLKAKFFWRVLPKEYLEIVKHTVKYNNEILPLIDVYHKKNYNSKKDIIFIGSDEVFNFLQENVNVGFSKNLFGENLKSSCICSYAASFGNTTMSRIKENNMTEIIENLLKNFSHISVRDENSYNIVKELNVNNPVINLDPVLLYDFTSELFDNFEKEKYIVIYAYRNRIAKNEEESIIEYAKEHGYKIISLGGYQSFSDKHVSCSPFEMLTYLKNAECVITDTFHGTIYSIIFRKRFASFVRKTSETSYGNEEKMLFLLNRFDLLDHVIGNGRKIKHILDIPINKNKISEIILIEKNSTRQYLRKVFGIEGANDEYN